MPFLDWLFGPEPDKVETRSQQFVLGDAFAAWLDGNGSLIEVTSDRAMGIPAFFRAVSIIAGTIATLPLKTYRESDSGRKRVKSFLDRPAGPYPLTPFAWKELVVVHLLTRGEAFLLHVYNNGGALIGLLPIHPDAVAEVSWSGASKVFKVQHDDKQETYTDQEMTHITGISTDGTRGLSPLSLFRSTIQGAIATDKAAWKVATSGLSIAALVTPEADLSETDAKAIKESLDSRMTGPENTGGIAVINRQLKVSPLSLSPEDAQFLESREFNVIEFARMFGIPPHLLGATEKQTSWGSGVAEQNLGLARYTLMQWTSRIEEAASNLLPSPRFAEFDYSGLLQGTPQDEIKLLIEQVNAGLMTVNEARAIRNMEPIEAEPEQETKTEPDSETEAGQANETE